MSYEFVVCLETSNGLWEALQKPGDGYISRDRAQRIADVLAGTFPSNRYRVARQMVRDDNGLRR